MFELIPNWHPVFVHFSIALLVISLVLHLGAGFVDSRAQQSIQTVSRWNLLIGVMLTLFTVVAGWLAYNSVQHDTPSHLAMTDHRNWAMVTFIVFIAIAIWELKSSVISGKAPILFTIVFIIATSMLLTTAWKGGELVYRYGLGVMALPDTGKHDHAAHDHDHATQGDSGHSESLSDESHQHAGDDAHDSDHHEHGAEQHDSLTDTDTEHMEQRGDQSQMEAVSGQPGSTNTEVHRHDDGHEHSH